MIAHSDNRENIDSLPNKHRSNGSMLKASYGWNLAIPKLPEPSHEVTAWLPLVETIR